MTWNRTDSDNIGNTYANTPTSGSVNLASSFRVGYHPGTTGPTVEINNNGYIGVSAGGYGTTQTKFGSTLSGGTFRLQNFFQFSDFDISIAGGNGTIDASGLIFRRGDNSIGTFGTHYSYSGNNTNFLTMDSKDTFGSEFYGDLVINGTWDTITITQKYNAEATLNFPNQGHNFDPDTNIQVINAQIATSPEPSSTALLGLGMLSLITRRKR